MASSSLFWLELADWANRSGSSCLEACCAKVVIVRPMLSYIVGKLLKNACQLKNPRSATLFCIEVIIFWRDFFAQKQTFFSYSEAHCSKLVSGNPMLSYIVRKLWKRAFQQKNPHITTTFSIRAKQIRKKNFFQKITSPKLKIVVKWGFFC